MKNRLKIKQSRLLSTVLIFLSGVSLTVAVYETNSSMSWKMSQIKNPTIRVCFTPGQKCASLIEDAIMKARQSIYVQAYSFTSKPLMHALIKAHEKGVIVKVLIDKSQLKEKHTIMNDLKNAGIEVAVDYMPGIAHNKVMIIDHTTVLTGSYNWTNAAEYRNAENLVMIHDAEIVRFYKENWIKRYKDKKRDLNK